ncbi:HlyD family secretion protein [Salinisphaera sp. USBA-960]|nr:HlyD family secretion protein [Salifodinibacter halophilus]NNC25338.1 HlyD family secretion protein [Salifodinibacter halophilus]
MASNQADNNHAPDDEPATTAQSNGKGKRAALFAVVLAVGTMLVAAAYWYLTRNEISTDNAFIKAHIVQIAPRINGHVTQVLVQDNEHVEKGQPLFKLDREPFQTRLDKAKSALAAAKVDRTAAQRDLALIQATSQTDIDAAKARLAAARAKAKRAQKNAHRYRSLYQSNQASAQRRDKATTAAKVARHEVDQAQAKLAKAKAAPKQIALKKAKIASAKARIQKAKSTIRQAKLNLSYTTVKAPHAGQIAKKSIQPGSQLGGGQSAMALVQTGRWVIANFKETQLTQMRVGQPVSVHIDAFPEREYDAHIQSIQAGTGPTFSLLPPENATGNYVKVVKRVPVKIVFDQPQQIKANLAPGMSVVPTVHLPSDRDNNHSHQSRPTTDNKQ